MAFKNGAESAFLRLGGKFIEGVGVTTAAEFSVKIAERILRDLL